MTPYKLSNIISFSLLLLLLVADRFAHIPLWTYGSILLVYISALGIGATYIQLNFYHPMLHHGDSSKKEIVLSYDDGPNPEITPQLLNLLASHQVTASFFCIGKKAANNKSLLQKINEGGHIIGNHSHSHPPLFDLYSPKRMEADLQRTNHIIKDVIGKTPLLFRPPYGVSNPMLAKAIRKTKMTGIGWRLRSFDSLYDADKVMRKITKNLRGGDIILLHDKDPKCLEITARLLVWLKENNYKVVGMEQLLNIKAYDAA